MKKLMSLAAILFVFVGAFSKTAMAQVVRPALLTYSATEVTKDSATLNGWVNTNGFDTDVWFHYGTTTAIYTQTEWLRVPAAQSQRVYSMCITGLQPATTYYFMAEGSSAYANAYGEMLSFTTLPDLSELNISVVDRSTGQPFGVASFDVWATNIGQSWHGQTDGDGRASLSIPSGAVLIVRAEDAGGHYAQYYADAVNWEGATRVSLPANITVSLVPVPVYCYPFNITDQQIGNVGGVVQYGIYLENRTNKAKAFTLWATRSFPNKGAMVESFPTGMKEAMEQREITLAPGESRKVFLRFVVTPSDPDGYYQVQFYLYNKRGAMINGGHLWFVKGEDNAKG